MPRTALARRARAVVVLLGASATLAIATTSAHADFSTNLCHLPAPQASPCGSGVQARQVTPATYPGSGIGGTGYAPADLRSAYRIPATGGAGRTVAVVLPFHHPTAESDLAAYRSGYSLPACSVAGGCLRIIDQNGGTSYPAQQLLPDWDLETSIDLDMVSATCPACRLLLVEANSASASDLAIASRRAVTAGASVVSISWGSDETTGDRPYDTYFHNTGVPIVAAAGDFGYNNHVATGSHPAGTTPEWPATHPEVIAVGGTTLTPATNARGWTETVWAPSGGGCSIYQAKPGWQTDPRCSHRMGNDVAAVGSDSTPVSMYNSTWFAGWGFQSGTSVTAPIVAGIVAQANNFTRSLRADAFYQKTASLYDITSGSNGTCTGSSYLCTATSGYDGPSGLGTPNGIPSLDWDMLSPPFSPTRGANIHDIACTSSTSCIAVGNDTVPFVDFDNPGYRQANAYQYNGSAWSASSNPDEPFGGVTLNGVTCLSATSCMAVGAYSSGNFIEKWSGGTSWQSLAAAEPRLWDPPSESYQGTTTLSDVSCTSATACTAVGSYSQNPYGGGPLRPLIERYNGASWSIQTPPAPPGSASGILSSVVCPAATTCFAVGTYYPTATTGRTFINYWNGTSWSTTPSTNPGTANALEGLSCTSTTACTTTGTYTSGSTSLSLAERWNGTSWTTQTTPNPDGALASDLRSVSCASATACTAVGTFTNSSGTQVTLAEAWNGTTWSLQSPPNGITARDTHLEGVSCPTATTCRAGGYYVDRNTQQQVPLVESYVGP
jgi:hypothetical protein